MTVSFQVDIKCSYHCYIFCSNLQGYESMTLDKDFYENKKVFILGRGK